MAKNKYVFNGDIGKAYQLVNSGKVLTQLNTKREHTQNLFDFLHQTIGVMNYTDKKGDVFFEIQETETGYSILLKWPTTKVKSETTRYYLELLQAGARPEGAMNDWRTAIFHYLEKLVSDCSLVRYNIVQHEKEFTADFFCEISFERLYAYPFEVDAVDKKFKPEGKEYSVPYELIKDFVGENFHEALSCFGKDHLRLFDILKPFEGKEFVADFLMGATYYLFLDMPNKAYAYLTRALTLSEKQGAAVPPVLLDFIGSIEHSRHESEKAEHTLIQSLLIGNEKGFLKLAYLYFENADSEKKDIALSLARIGEKILPFMKDEKHRLGGYHIAATVYLWNNEFGLAEDVHRKFLENQPWCEEFPELVSVYLLLAIALIQDEFLANIFLDYPHIIQRFRTVFDCWQCKEINPFDKRFKGEFIETLKLLEFIKEKYGIK